MTLKKLFCSAASLALVLNLSVKASAQTPVGTGNPYLPLWEHLPDGEPRVFEDPDNPGKYRAYIIGPTPAAPAQGRQYSFDFNGTTTAIDNVTISGMEDGAWYTISGIRVNRPAAKGVYIHNARKVIVK